MFKEKPMLEKTEWMKINKHCHALVDEDNLILAVVLTSYDPEEGDDNLIWDVELGGQEMGSYISLYSAQLAVQKHFSEMEQLSIENEEKRKSRKKKKVVSEVSTGNE